MGEVPEALRVLIGQRLDRQQVIAGERLGPHSSNDALATDLVADVVFLAVQHVLIVAGEVAAVACGHAALLVAEPVILAMKLARLAVADLALAALLVDPAVLMAQPVVHFVAPRMVRIPGDSAKALPADDTATKPVANATTAIFVSLIESIVKLLSNGRGALGRARLKSRYAPVPRFHPRHTRRNCACAAYGMLTGRARRISRPAA